MTIIPIVIGAFGTVTKGLLKGTGGFGNKGTSGDYLHYYIIGNGQKYWEEFWRLVETSCHSSSSERPSANTNVKNSNNNNNNKGYG